MQRPAKVGGCVLACGVVFLAGVASADILFFFLDEGQQGEWEAALNAHRQEVSETFNLTDELGDPGSYSRDGPIEFGTISIDSNLHPFGTGGRAGRGSNGTGLTVIGQSAGFGNEETAVVANYFVDSFDIFHTSTEYPTAAEFAACSFLGSNTVAVTVYDPNENEIAQLLGFTAPPRGSRLAILATDGDVIGRINIYDTPVGGEGIVGTFTAYVEGPPVPAELISFDVVTGRVLEGGLDDLTESDELFLHTRSGLGRRLSEAHLMELLIEARTEEAGREIIAITIESRITEPDGVATIRLKNWRTGEFDRIGRYGIGMKEETHTVQHRGATDYVRPSGAVELSIKNVVFVPFLAFRFDSFFDWVKIVVE